MCGAGTDPKRAVKWDWHVGEGKRQESAAHRGAALLTVCGKDKSSLRLFFLRHHLTFFNATETPIRRFLDLFVKSNIFRKGIL